MATAAINDTSLEEHDAANDAASLYSLAIMFSVEHSGDPAAATAAMREYLLSNREALEKFIQRMVMHACSSAVSSVGRSITLAAERDQRAIEDERCESAAHAHNRAKRYMEKRFLRELWQQWRKG